MRAIVSVKKGSAYAKHNGHTYEVKEILPSIIALDINGNTVDFTFKEVIIIDFKKEFKEAVRTENSELESKLYNYINVNGLFWIE